MADCKVVGSGVTYIAVDRIGAVEFEGQIGIVGRIGAGVAKATPGRRYVHVQRVIVGRHHQRRGLILDGLGRGERHRGGNPAHGAKPVDAPEHGRFKGGGVGSCRAFGGIGGGIHGNALGSHIDGVVELPHLLARVAVHAESRCQVQFARTSARQARDIEWRPGGRAENRRNLRGYPGQPVRGE